MRHPVQQQHSMLPMSEAEEAALGLGANNGAGNSGNGGNAGNSGNNADHCPKHGGGSGGGNGSGAAGGNGSGNKNDIESLGNNKDSIEQHSSSGLNQHGPSQPPIILPPGSSPQGGPGGSGNKKQDPKEIMKKRRERAICIDRVSRVIFPSTFILLNIIYWLVFSEILDAIKQSVGSDDQSH